MSNVDPERIASNIKQINSRLQEIEESVTSIKDEIPSNLNYRLFNIQSNLSEIDRNIKYKSTFSGHLKSPSTLKPAEKSTNAINVNDDYDIQIEKHKRYLKKHLNNAIQKHLSELDAKMNKLESDYVTGLNLASNASTTTLNSFTDLKSKITKSFNDFNVKYQDLYSKISNSQVQKKFAYEKAANHLEKSLDMQVKQQKKDIEAIKAEMDETQKLLNEVNTEKASQNKKASQNALLTPEQNEKNIIKEQNEKINYLNSHWLEVSESLTRQLLYIDNHFDVLLESAESIKNSMENYEQKITVLQIGREKVDGNFDSIQDQITEESYKLEQSCLKLDISRFRQKATLSLEDDKNQIEALENYVNQLYDKLAESYSA